MSRLVAVVDLADLGVTPSYQPAVTAARTAVAVTAATVPDPQADGAVGTAQAGAHTTQADTDGNVPRAET